ncbi:MAG: transcription elongation factor GreB, partial [Pseudomonadota bacterium]|nr:transcription elongation factor GreB [Pseudomonadota bacterium]
MSRYRPPQKSGAKYITSEGEQRLKKELHQLWKIDRPQVTQSV